SLRALPQPPVPADLEARLLAGIPDRLPVPRRRWPVWIGVAGALAAACLLVVLAWSRRDRRESIPSTRGNGIVNKETPRPPAEPDDLAAWQEARRTLDSEQIPGFAWPLGETSSVTASTASSSEMFD